MEEKGVSLKPKHYQLNYRLKTEISVDEDVPLHRSLQALYDSGGIGATTSPYSDNTVVALQQKLKESLWSITVNQDCVRITLILSYFANRYSFVVFIYCYLFIYTSLMVDVIRTKSN